MQRKAELTKTKKNMLRKQPQEEVWMSHLDRYQQVLKEMEAEKKEPKDRMKKKDVKVKRGMKEREMKQGREAEEEKEVKEVKEVREVREVKEAKDAKVEQKEKEEIEIPKLNVAGEGKLEDAEGTSTNPGPDSTLRNEVAEEADILEEHAEELSENEEDKVNSELDLDTDKFEFRTTDTALCDNKPSSSELATPTPPFDVQSVSTTRELPLCARCNSLLHQNSAAPLSAYPDLNSLVGLIAESKHEKNHIFHLIDAADFPLSLVPRLRSYLTQHLPPQKAKNLHISYVVTRADLLMPRENQVNSLMTYLRNTLKAALPKDEPIEDHQSPYGGIFRVVSVRNGWSTRKVKAEFSQLAGMKLSHAEKGKIKIREGGMWIVGKVNVGKSEFVGNIVPEGSFTNLERVIETVAGEIASYKPEIEDLKEGKKSIAFLKEYEEQKKDPSVTEESLNKILENAKIKLQNEELHQEELPFVTPTVSHHPGTTVAPVRVSFRHAGDQGRKGGVKGEIIDLPGMERGRFSEFVRPEKRTDVQMRERVDPEQYVVIHGRSMLLAGLIMIQPKTIDTDFIMYPYTTLPVHVTNTEKALKLMNHPDPENCRIPELYQHKPDQNTLSKPAETNNSAIEGVSINAEVHDDAGQIRASWKDDLVPATFPSYMKSAGVFPLLHDVTRQRNPLLAGKSDAEIELLPYKVYSSDILLEGIGWVEVVAQVRQQQIMTDVIPEVEVFTPLGKGVGSRTPMGTDALRLQGLKKIGKYGKRRTPNKGRRRESMKGRKKEGKKRHREATRQG